MFTTDEMVWIFQNIFQNGIDPQSVILSDEKWFSLTPQQNRQDTQY